MRKILAISGGVDSMVLLKMYQNDNIVVAHFDHGTRPSSKDDAEFVRRVCDEVGVPFVVEHAELGEQVAEATAREARYQFLYRVAREQNGEIYLAHHLDDLLESAVINLLRGTGWRGLSPMGNTKVKRSLLEKGFTKKDILNFAAEHQVMFRQDPTNTEDNYLRNRVRQILQDLSEDTRQKLLVLIKNQGALKNEVDKLLQEILPKDGVYQRAWFNNLDEALAVEILRASLLAKNIRLTRPQLLDFLTAIKTYQPEKSFNLPGGRLVKIHKTYYNI